MDLPPKSVENKGRNRNWDRNDLKSLRFQAASKLDLKSLAIGHLRTLCLGKYVGFLGALGLRGVPEACATYSGVMRICNVVWFDHLHVRVWSVASVIKRCKLNNNEPKLQSICTSANEGFAYETQVMKQKHQTWICTCRCAFACRDWSRATAGQSCFWLNVFVACLRTFGETLLGEFLVFFFNRTCVCVLDVRLWLCFGLFSEARPQFAHFEHVRFYLHQMNTTNPTYPQKFRDGRSSSVVLALILFLFCCSCASRSPNSVGLCICRWHQRFRQSSRHSKTTTSFSGPVFYQLSRCKLFQHTWVSSVSCYSGKSS